MAGMKLDQGSYNFFYGLSKAVQPFRSRHNVPGSNVNGCIVVRGTGKDAGKIRFGFMAKDDRIVHVDIVAKDIMADPKTYIELMLERINHGMNELDKNDRKIIIAAPKIERLH